MSKYKNEISFKFYSESDDIAEYIADMLLDVLEENDFDIKHVHTTVITDRNKINRVR